MASAELKEISVAPLAQEDLEEAATIFRLAFGTFLGFPDPENFHQGFNYIHSRWKTNPAAFYAAKSGDKLLGTNYASNWGSIGFFGPLTIHPDYWNRGVGKLLMEPIISLFEHWGTKHAGLYTFAQSAKHVGLYQQFGFMPRYLTAIMSRAVKPASGQSISLFSSLSGSEKSECLRAVRELTDELYEGLEVTIEIEAVDQQKLGDTVLVWNEARLEGLAVCHCGEGSEAGPGTCFIKFGAARPGQRVEENFAKLLDDCDALASARGLGNLSAGVNTARVEAYRMMIDQNFRTVNQGVAMHRTREVADLGYSKRGIFVLDDWR